MNSSIIAVCDTEPIAIEGIRSLLETHHGVRVISIHAAPELGLEAVRQIRPSMVVLDRDCGVTLVMNWLRELRTERMSPGVVVWGSNISEAEALRYVQSGVGGVVRKTAALSDVLSCFRAVLAGSTWMEYDLLPEPDLAFSNARSNLTPRELQVVDLVKRGLKNREIALALGIQTGTVKIHLKHIFEKTGIRGRYGLALSGLREQHGPEAMVS